MTNQLMNFPTINNILLINNIRGHIITTYVLTRSLLEAISKKENISVVYKMTFVDIYYFIVLSSYRPHCIDDIQLPKLFENHISDIFNTALFEICVIHDTIPFVQQYKRY